MWWQGDGTRSNGNVAVITIKAIAHITRSAAVAECLSNIDIAKTISILIKEAGYWCAACRGSSYRH